MTGDTCPVCGQALPEPAADDCVCGHSRDTHNITPGRRKAECSRFGPDGKCPCPAYSPVVTP
jgi:hypothetical protein